MKSRYLFFLMVLISTTIYAQENGNDVVIALPNINVLYAGISNPIQIAVPGITSEKITATVTNGSITKTGTGWEIQPTTESEPVILTVSVNNQKLTEKTFRVISIPVLHAVLAGKVNGAVSKNEIIKTGILEIEMNEFLLNNSFDVKSYNFQYSENGNNKEISVNSNKLTDEIKSIISNMKSGQDVIFKDIKVASPDGRTQNISPLILSID